MKLIALLNSASSQALDRVLGPAAGRTRSAQIRAAATDLIRHPKVQQVASDLTGRAQANAHRLPGPAAGLVNRAASRVRTQLTSQGTVRATSDGPVGGTVPTPDEAPTRLVPPPS